MRSVVVCKSSNAIGSFRLSSSAPAPFKASSLTIKRTEKPKIKLPNDQLKFGATFTDHMLTIPWNSKAGWGAPAIVPYGPLSLDPSALVFHYALECFEGMKAYVDAKEKIRLFRPLDNMKRMNSSLERLAMPKFPENEFLDTIKSLIKLEKDWIPRGNGFSLYIRPTAIATTALLGVSPPQDILLYVILSPVGPYYPTGFKPVSLFADTQHVRAFPGGAGGYKLGSNYGPTILPALKASQRGFQQILWLHKDSVTEVGTMNLFCFWKNEKGEKELITAPLDGTILPGVTRQSILDLSRAWGEYKVTERDWKITELVKALQEKRVIEVFGAGTAAVVSPVKSFEYQGTLHEVPCKDGVAGDLTRRLLDEITAIQYGVKDHPWSVVVEE